MQLNRNALKRFSQNEDGTIAIIFGLTAFVAILTTGLAIDVGRIMHAERKITASIDAAALAAAKAMRDTGATDARAQEIAEQFFRENMAGSGGDYANINALNVNVDRNKNAITIDVDASVKTMFGGVAGIDKISFPKSSTALYDTKDIELGLQLDITGSMQGRKLQDLKDAVAGNGGLLDIMFPEGGTTNRVRIGLAPYAAGVNAGDYAMAVSRNRATNGCVYERANLNDQDTDLPATGGQSLKAASDLARNAQACPRDAKVMALTDDKIALRNEVNRWSAGGSTAGHLGTAWAWYLISPQWSALWPNSSRPAPYNDGI